MRRQVTAVLFLVALSGCSRSDPELQLDLSDIRILCDDVGNREFSIVNSRDSDRATLKGLEQIKAGKAAECELEYRIRQQEANKPF